MLAWAHLLAVSKRLCVCLSLPFHHEQRKQGRRLELNEGINQPANTQPLHAVAVGADSDQEGKGTVNVSLQLLLNYMLLRS